MEVDLIVLLVGGIITLVTQYVKPAANINPLYIAAGLSVVAGIGYAALLQVGYWDSVVAFATQAFPAAVTVYQILKQAGLVSNS